MKKIVNKSCRYFLDKSKLVFLSFINCNNMLVNMANSIKMALGRKRLYNFSVFPNSGEKLLKTIQKKRQGKFHFYLQL